LKTMNCPQCGGVLHLTQYAGVYHCRYCRNLVESNVIELREIALREQEVRLQRYALAKSMAEENIMRVKKEKKLKKWQHFCLFWWGFILLTLLLGIFAQFCSAALAHTLAIVIGGCLKLRAAGSLAVTCIRPDDCYEISAPPVCSKSVLLFLFWFADMFQWVFVIAVL